MSRLIFLNLAIDQLWDAEKNLASLFPARIPESEHLVRINENLGVYLSNEDDVVLGYQDTAGFRNFLAERGFATPPTLEVSHHPFDQHQWIQETVQKLESQGPFSELISASISPLEQSLLDHPLLSFRSKPSMRSEALANLNRKTFLLELSKLGLAAVPETELVWQKDLVTSQIPAFSEQRILKHDFGSGGAANFLVNGSGDPLLQLLKRRLDPTMKARWLLQKQLTPKIEGSIFGWTHDPRPARVALIQYSSQGLSYRHEFGCDENLHQKAQAIYNGIQNHLLKLGYTGPIGLDFLQDERGDQLWIVDLNLRLTKTHLLGLALEKLALPFENTISIRHRWKSQEALSFQNWWQQCRSDFNLNAKGESPDGNFMIPYSVSGIEAPGGMKEVSVFLSRSLGFEKIVLDRWGTI